MKRSLLYNFFSFGILENTRADYSEDMDLAAQSMCNAINPTGATAAIRKKCGDKHINCQTACLLAAASMKQLSGDYGGRPACFGALLIYESRNLEKDEVYRASRVYYKYGKSWGCSTYGCGPNYCCCNYQ